MSYYRGSESKWGQFRRYLEKAGVLDTPQCLASPWCTSFYHYLQFKSINTLAGGKNDSTM
uniref:Uncharacterized protein n=1 Tax=Oncorhynchus tshawytscha TaxID=74940 RepID=A0AAZ3PVT2_ONCTS